MPAQKQPLLLKLSVLVVEFEVSIPCLEQARESAERFDQVGGQFWAAG